MSPDKKPAEALPDVRSARTLARLVRRFVPFRAETSGTLFLYLARTACDLSVSWLIGVAIGMLATAHGKGVLPDEFVSAVWILAVVMVARISLMYLSTVAAAALSQKIENGLRSELFAKVTNLRFTYHDENRSGKTIARALRDMEKSRLFFREVAFGYLDALLMIAGVLVASFLAHWTYGVAITLVVGTAFGLTLWVGVRIAKMDRVISDNYDRVSTNLQENVAGARVVRAFGREPEEPRR